MNHWTCSNLLEKWSRHRYECWHGTGETPETFLQMLGKVNDAMTSDDNDASIICLSPANQLLLTLIWLRQYPTYWLLSLIFEISVSSVSRVINRTWPILWENLSPDVKWPSSQQWNSLHGSWQEMSDVAVIDGISHEIHRPQDGQEDYYSGNRHMHCFHTIVIIYIGK